MSCTLNPVSSHVVEYQRSGRTAEITFDVSAVFANEFCEFVAIAHEIEDRNQPVAVLVRSLHACNEAADAWLTKLSVTTKVFLPPDAELLGLSVLMSRRRAEQWSEFVDLHSPALVDEVDQRVGGCRQPRLAVNVAQLGRTDPQIMIEGDFRVEVRPRKPRAETVEPTPLAVVDPAGRVSGMYLASSVMTSAAFVRTLNSRPQGGHPVGVPGALTVLRCERTTARAARWMSANQPLLHHRLPATAGTGRANAGWSVLSVRLRVRCVTADRNIAVIGSASDSSRY